MPTVEKFTHAFLKSVAAESGYTEYWDESFPTGSFGIRVSAKTGKKKFILRYRNSEGKRRRVTIGSFDPNNPSGLSLTEARGKAVNIMADVSRGEDPGAGNEYTKDVQSFEDLFELFLEKHCSKLSDRTKRDYIGYAKKDLLPRWSDRKPGDITREDVIEVLDHIAFDRNGPTTSNRTRSMIHKLFNFAINRGIVESNPCKGVPKRGKEKKRERVLNEEEVSTFWNVLKEEKTRIKCLFRLLLLTAQRSGETRRMKWSHINDNVWTIPSKEAKNNRENRVPITSLAKETIEDLREETGDSKWVFDSKKRDGPLKWLHDANVRLREKCGFYFVLHDLRRTAASHMASLGVDRITVAKVLNHKSVDNAVTAVYERYSYEEEKREALNLWETKIREIVDGL